MRTSHGLYLGFEIHEIPLHRAGEALKAVPKVMPTKMMDIVNLSMVLLGSLTVRSRHCDVCLASLNAPSGQCGYPSSLVLSANQLLHLLHHQLHLLLPLLLTLPLLLLVSPPKVHRVQTLLLYIFLPPQSRSMGLVFRHYGRVENGFVRMEWELPLNLGAGFSVGRSAVISSLPRMSVPTQT